jgi:hypothetical protein
MMEQQDQPTSHRSTLTSEVEDEVKMMLLTVIAAGEGRRVQLKEVVLVAQPPLPPTYLFVSHRRELERRNGLWIWAMTGGVEICHGFHGAMYKSYTRVGSSYC